MGEQETLLPLDPNKVQVPIIVGRQELAEHDRAGVEQIEHLLRAAHDHSGEPTPVGRPVMRQSGIRGSHRRADHDASPAQGVRPARLASTDLVGPAQARDVADARCSAAHRHEERAPGDSDRRSGGGRDSRRARCAPSARHRRSRSAPEPASGSRRSLRNGRPRRTRR